MPLILRDEAPYIDFHRDRLAARHPEGLGILWAVQFWLLAEACAWFLWMGHGDCFRALGGTRAELFSHMRRGVAGFLAELEQRRVATNGATASSIGVEVSASRAVV